MKPEPGLPSIVSRQDYIIQRHDDHIWEEICDLIPLNHHFRVSDLLGRLSSISRYAETTQRYYIRATLENAVLFWKHRPEEPAHIRKPWRGTYILPSIHED